MAKNWLTRSTRITAGYMRKGLKFMLYGHRAINQFVFFKETVEIIRSRSAEAVDKNRTYLKVAVESIRLLEQIREALWKESA